VAQYNSAEYMQHIKPMFHLEPCIYGHRILSRAASIFAAVRHMPAPPCYDVGPPPPAADSLDGGSGAEADQATPRRRSGRKAQNAQPQFEYQSRAEKRLSFTLVFQTLKCEIINSLTTIIYPVRPVICPRPLQFYNKL